MLWARLEREQSCVAGRHVEQQRQQHALRPSEQQHADERQQQQRLSLCEGDSERGGPTVPTLSTGRSAPVHGLPQCPERKPTSRRLFPAGSVWRGTKSASNRGLVASGRALVEVPGSFVLVACLLLSSVPGLADVVYADSPDFTLDTRLVSSVAFADSKSFTLDTRGVLVGGVSGRVLDGSTSLPLSGAGVRIDQSEHATTSDGSGHFNLTGVAAGNGYRLTVSRDGYGSHVANFSITSGTLALGDIRLYSALRPYRLIPLVPDVNPGQTVVEEGGTAYRYYRVVAADGRTPVGNVPVSVQILGGGTIPQSGDVSDHWAGRVAGVSDPDGIVRVRVPSSSIGGPGSLKGIQVLESGVVKQTFTASVFEREYDQVWRHEVGGGVKGKLLGAAVKGQGAYEAEVRDKFVGGLAQSEQIKRTRAARLQIGAEAGGGVRVGSLAKASYEASAYGYAGVDLGSTFNFNPNTADPAENLMKLYVALGDPLELATGPAAGIVRFVRERVEPYFLDSRLESVAGNFRLGGGIHVEGGIGTKLSNNALLGAGAQMTSESEAIVGYEEYYSPVAEKANVYGVATRGELSIEAGASIAKDRGLKVSGFFGGEGSFIGRVVKDLNGTTVKRVELEQSVGHQQGFGVGLERWKPYRDAVLDSGYYRRFTETVKVPLTHRTDFTRLASANAVWNAVAGGGGGSVISISSPAALTGSLLQTFLEDGTPMDYETSVYVGVPTSANLDLKLDVVAAGLGVEIEGSIERGAEVVGERGKIWQWKRLAQEQYPKPSPSLLPSETILWKEAVWLGNALDPIGYALNEFWHFIAAAGQTIIEAGVGSTKATLVIDQGSLPEGSGVVSQYVLTSRGASPAPVAPGGQVTAAGGSDEPLPPVGADNYVYGLGGVYRFESTNAFNGTGTLTIAYTDADVTNLVELDLRIYRLPDGAKRWELVGGTVNAASNRVTTAITQLGTYAVAPPLPTGDLSLDLSTPAIAADGTSILLAAVTNVLLNTGGVATQAWLFTVYASGLVITNADWDTNLAGVQIVSTNAELLIGLRTPVGGTVGSVSVASVAGDAFGYAEVNLVDGVAPATPTNVTAVAGQSRVWVSWSTNLETDLASYRVYYRAGSNGPPFDGTASVEGSASPVATTATNLLLRGLSLGNTYYIAMTAVDTSGNESPYSSSVQVTTTQQSPSAPTAVAVRFEPDGTNVLMWALSEDDGYNDRDVARYDVWRAVLPGGAYLKVGEVPAGTGMFSETNTPVAAANYLRYAVTAVDTNGLSSNMILGNRVLAGTVGIDNDGDGMEDGWESLHALNPEDPLDALADADADGLTNQEEYLLGLLPNSVDRPRVEARGVTTDGGFVLGVMDAYGRSGTLQFSTNLLNWEALTSWPAASTNLLFEDLSATNSTQRFYRVLVP